MITTEISLSINRKSDLQTIQQAIVAQRIQFPVYIREFETSYQIDFNSDEEEWELDTAILQCFADYEFTTDLEKGRKEIRIQIHRYQSELSCNDWGRPIENPLDHTKYLVKKSATKTEKFNPEITVLFGDKAQHYYAHIVDGINTATEEKGFLLLDHFSSSEKQDDTEVLKDRLYRSKLEAFQYAFHKIGDLVDSDFSQYLAQQKKETQEIQKLPRKIVRDFINACNQSDIEGIVNNLADQISYEIRSNWKTIFSTEGITEFKNHLGSPNQNLLDRDFKIRSSWTIDLPHITIGVKYFPTAADKSNKFNLKYGAFKFVLNCHKIIQIIDES